jgi:hypothetical protein
MPASQSPEVRNSAKPTQAEQNGTYLATDCDMLLRICDLDLRPAHGRGTVHEAK